ncbi:MAG: tyrosine--tRNA ligase [Candidatus Portnoybacteria bacterium]|nr:tyrosine--tRNA ligase [Candidatus Portnoybacteria bacterium]
MARIITDNKKIKEALERGVEKIYPTKNKLEGVLKSGKRIRLYCGYDPTAPSLHIGHAITLRKLSHFQKLGHEIIMLIGDFTAMIGDPTDKKAVRKKLSRQDVQKNLKNYKKMASKIISFSGPNPAKAMYNSKWNDKLKFSELIELASSFTVQQMITRDMFQERIKKEKPIYLHEFLYPLIQAYDSLKMNVDLEIGGSDQTFNMLCGRDLIKNIKGKEKFVLTTKLLEDPSGKKMGKTEGNMIKLDDNPKDMYGKVMAWPDFLIIPGLELCTGKKLEDIKKAEEKMNNKKANPRDVKADLAWEIVKENYSKKEADKARKQFDQVFKEKNTPQEAPIYKVRKKSINILDLLLETKLASSKSEAKRLINQGAVKIKGKIIKGWDEEIDLKKEKIIQVGKKNFRKIKSIS